MNRLPTLIAMPIAYALVLALIPFALIALCVEWAVYKFRSLK